MRLNPTTPTTDGFDVNQSNELDQHRWIGRPWIARLVRVSVYVVPFTASILGAFLLSSIIPPLDRGQWP